MTNSTKPATPAPEVVERLKAIASFTAMEAAALIEAQRLEIAELRVALEEIAEQRLADSMSPQEYADANFEEGYDCCVRRARLALTPER